MAEYIVTAPDGKEITLEGPAGASQAEIIAQAQKLYQPKASVEVMPAPAQFGETGGGAAVGRPQGLNRTNVQATPRPLESAMAALTKEAVINPVLGIAQLATGGNVGSEAAQRYAEQAKPYQEENPASYFAGQIGGAIAPAAGIAKGIGMIPSFAKAAPVLQNIGGAVAQGALMPNETGKTGTEFYTEKAKEAPRNALLGVIPTVGGKTAELLGSLLRKGTGISTGAGEEALKQAYQAGKTGNTTFVENMRGQVPIESVLADAKSALGNMRQDLSKQYKLGMMDVSKDKSVLNFDEIDKALNKAKDIGSYQGKVLNEPAGNVLQKIRAAVDDWKNADPKVFHTPEGMDALKQKIGGILEEVPFESAQARTVAQNIYHSIKNTIAEQAPVYNDVMKDYAKGSELIHDITKSLSLGKNSQAATSLNRLQSVMRNNVNTNYGYRQEMVKALEEQGGKELMPALAGQALNAYTPRGLVGQGMDAAALFDLIRHPEKAAVLAATVGTTSPRLMGEAAYGMGKVASKLPKGENAELAKLLMIKAAQEGMKNE